MAHLKPSFPPLQPSTPSHPSALFDMECHRLVQAATALSLLFQGQGIRHAFYGSIFPALLAKNPASDEIFCIVEGGQSQAHPFRRVRDAIAGSEDFTVTHSTWTNRLHVSYRRLIPAIDIEILPAGETGPRVLDNPAVMKVMGIPFLSYSEFIRAKLKSWMIRGSERDALDITFVLANYWDRIDMNRIPDQDMNVFASRNPTAAPAWGALRKKYGM
ncbi:hypothetical protein FA15DRAFT_584332 [Coprinopsis marcescibilis]|uniref:Uncharacterized protein n=1 Tax=Coprinopsis marcescibilis TaxID=230819 RepID=A0A5C3L788_COPMA|nr:hypothetical protein FA15DRAFT_584332 [Coprinopsis marcescibilis]